MDGPFQTISTPSFGNLCKADNLVGTHDRASLLRDIGCDADKNQIDMNYWRCLQHRLRLLPQTITLMGTYDSQTPRFFKNPGVSLSGPLLDVQLPTQKAVGFGFSGGNGDAVFRNRRDRVPAVFIYIAQQVQLDNGALHGSAGAVD